MVFGQNIGREPFFFEIFFSDETIVNTIFQQILKKYFENCLKIIWWNQNVTINLWNKERINQPLKIKHHELRIESDNHKQQSR